MLAEDVEQGGFDGGHRVHGDPQVECLRAATARVAVAEGVAQIVEHGVVVADTAADDDLARILQGAADRLAARHFTDAGVAVGVGDDDEVSGEERPVCAAEVQQHAVVAGDRDHRHVADDGNTHRSLLLLKMQTTCRRWPVAGPRATPCRPWCAGRR